VISRRGLLRIGAGVAGSLALRPFGVSPALAQAGNDYRALVCVFLYGGNDSNNLIVPQDADRYKAYVSLRGPLALQGKQLTPPVFSKTGNAPYAFHAGLAELAQLFSARQLAVVANVGSLVQPLTAAQYQARSAGIPRNLFSHIDQQLQWQTSIANADSATGWAGRAADKIAANNASNFPVFVSTAGNCVLGTGEKTQPICLNPGQSLTVPSLSGSAQATQSAAVQALLTLNPAAPLIAQSNQVMASLLSAGQSLTAALAQAQPLHTTFPATNLGSQLQQIAQVIQARGALGVNRQIFFCALGGFDTHAAQIETYNALYPQLSQSLASFYTALAEMGVQNSVVTFTESEFSRTFQPTSQGDGSDHGWGGHQLVLGGAVAGGDIYGSFPKFDLNGPDDTGDGRGRWIPTTSVDQYAATLCSWLGVAAADLQTILPNLKNYATKSLPFLG
jgi:uncharacterized protein (DUF1501 family)